MRPGKPRSPTRTKTRSIDEHAADAVFEGADQHHPLAALGVVGELHGYPTAKGMPDHADPFDAEDREQVAHAVCVTAKGVVGPRLSCGASLSDPSALERSRCQRVLVDQPGEDRPSADAVGVKISYRTHRRKTARSGAR